MKGKRKHDLDLNKHFEKKKKAKKKERIAMISDITVKFMEIQIFQ